MVKLSIRLLNQKDTYLRSVLITLDKPPAKDWIVKQDYSDKSEIRATRIKSGDTLEGTFDIKDGVHLIYLAVGMDAAGGLGSWSGVANIGGISRSFEGVDFNTLAAFKTTVKGGKVTDTVNANKYELSGAQTKFGFEKTASTAPTSQRPPETKTVPVGYKVPDTPTQTTSQPPSSPSTTPGDKASETATETGKNNMTMDGTKQFLKDHKGEVIVGSVLTTILVGTVWAMKKSRRF